LKNKKFQKEKKRKEKKRKEKLKDKINLNLQTPLIIYKKYIFIKKTRIFFFFQDEFIINQNLV
jgi:hypothetical protein